MNTDLIRWYSLRYGTTPTARQAEVAQGLWAWARAQAKQDSGERKHNRVLNRHIMARESK